MSDPHRAARAAELLEDGIVGETFAALESRALDEALNSIGTERDEALAMISAIRKFRKHIENIVRESKAKPGRPGVA